MHDMARDTDARWSRVSAPEPLLQTRELTFASSGERLIEGVDLDIRPGRCTVIMGANGAGKSVLLRLLHGLLRPSGGGVLWRGRTLDTRARRAQSMVFQRPVLLRRSVRANLRFALKVAGVRGAEARAREARALEQAHLSEHADRPARLLSVGQQQRLAVARALATDPKMLLLDEPTASLDPASTAAIEAQVVEARAAGVTVVLVTHDAGQARRMGDDLVFLDAGRVVETGPVANVLAAPGAPATRAWIEGRLYLPLGTRHEQQE